jgi:nucleotide-binding universal stress UspA family protein
MARPIAELQRILVATDFSDGSREALTFALGVARQFQSRIFLVHVIPAAVFRYVSPEDSEEAALQAKRFAAQEMGRLVAKAGCAGQVQEEILCRDAVWPMLQEFAKANAVDLIVLGTHGRSHVKRRLLGPVAEEIFRLAERPVLTVGSFAENATDEAEGVRRILYATNFKPHAERAASYAYSMEREPKTRLTVLHVVEEQVGSPTEGGQIVHDFLIQRMKKSVPAGWKGKREPDFQIRFGDPAEEILRLAREEEFDLIVLGMRSGKNAAAGLLPSAVAYELACQSPCPVLTIRH